MTKAEQLLNDFAAAAWEQGYTLEGIKFSELPRRMIGKGPSVGICVYESDVGVIEISGRDVAADSSMPIDLFEAPKRPVCDECGEGPVCPGCGRADC